jgi:uncharacterized membrane protein HdeD (DUF308 family)
MYSEDMFIIKGILGILFGIMIVIFPGFTLGTFYTIFALFMITAGIIAFSFAVTSQPEDTSVWFWLSLCILAVGVLSLVIPTFIAFTFALIIAGWALVSGIFDLERYITGTRAYYYLFLAMLGTGILVLVAVFYLVPVSREHYLETTFGVFAFVFGIFSLVLGVLILKGKLPDVLARSPGQQ